MKYFKIPFLFALAICSLPTRSEILTYKIESRDQLGSIFLSLGQKKVWSKDGKVNLFKKRENIKSVSRIYPGEELKLNESDILFKKNIAIQGNQLVIIKKINTLDEYEILLANEKLTTKEDVVVDKPDIVQPIAEADLKLTTHSLNLYPGIGFFMANNSEVDRSAKTASFSGIQPMIEIKAIYSNDDFGSFSIDLLTKKIIQKTYNFPLNFDYRLQLIPKWNVSNSIRLALSHSTITHSYVGKHSLTDLKYKLTSHFIGLGLVVPRDHYWFELYLEKAYSGKTTSSEYSQKTTSGFRIDTEWVYPITEKLRILPGINYYRVNQTASQYQLSVIETRLNLAREFEF